MNRRKFLAAAAAVSLASRASLPAETSFDADSNLLEAPASGSGGPNHQRYRLTLDRVLHGTGPAYTSDFLLADLTGAAGRRFTEFSGDLSGRWIGALAASSASFGDEFPELDAFVKRALPLQHAEGYFGKSFSSDAPGDNDLALLWGNGRLLVGLMEYHALRSDAASLEAAKRLGDFLVGIGPRFNSDKMAEDFGAGHFATSYICWTQQTEGLALLYAATKDRRYRDLCAAIAGRMQRRPGDHVHGYLCSVRGTLMLYEATRDARFLEQVVAAQKDIAESGDVLITGGVPEAWSPKKKRTEGCAECDWLRLNLALYRATGNEMYLTTAEKILFNDFAMNQSFTGDFGHGVLEEGGTPETVPVRAWWCCTLHGLRAFPDVHGSVFRRAAMGLAYELPLDGTFKAQEATLEARSSLGTDGTVRILVKQAVPGTSLTVRQPNWTDAVELAVNGKKLAGLQVNELHTGDTIVAHYAMHPRQESADRVQSRPGRKAMFYGPWLLGASSHEQSGYFNELFPDNEIWSHKLKPSQQHDLRAFAVPIAATTCGFVPAEFPDQGAEVELRSVAEQTGYEPARWQTAFVVVEKG